MANAEEHERMTGTDMVEHTTTHWQTRQVLARAQQM